MVLSSIAEKSSDLPARTTPIRLYHKAMKEQELKLAELKKLYQAPLPSNRSGALYNAFSYPTKISPETIAIFIACHTNIGDTVLDPFCGTFTTRAVAQRLARRSIGVELQAEYVKIGLRRLQVSTHFNGEKLEPLDKSYVRRNANGVHGAAVAAADEQAGLFDG